MSRNTNYPINLNENHDITVLLYSDYLERKVFSWTQITKIKGIFRKAQQATQVSRLRSWLISLQSRTSVVEKINVSINVSINVQLMLQEKKPYGEPLIMTWIKTLIMTLISFSNTDSTDKRDYLAYARDWYPKNPEYLWFIYSEHETHERNETFSFILYIPWSKINLSDSATLRLKIFDGS